MATQPQKLNMPRDDFGSPVPVLAAKVDGAKKGVAASATSRIGPFTDGVRIFEIWVSQDTRYQTGDETVVATAASHFVAAGERLPRALGGRREGEALHTHIAIIRAGATDAFVEISELE